MTELPPETVNAAASRVSDILKPNGAQHGGPPMTLREIMDSEDHLGAPLHKTPRAKRSDAGKPRQPKPAAPEGKLSKAQMNRFDELLAARDEAKTAYLSAQEVFEAFREEITAK
jgi:hypothetical protein